MAYSEALAGRLRDALARQRGVVEKKMFGGVAFLLEGHMCVGVWKDSLIARLGPDEAEPALRRRHVYPFDPTGRPMRGWVLVGPDAIDDDHSLANWVDTAVRFVRTLPPK
ncbi:MAG: TfoX/Sxy family protein [Planctomycetota bacterium]|nr:TfoX/Sxy family protein [Planctomycetaceae bacterium]MDQ3332458.1 TfoX/Sxy family protein [Planctomycetota bacterium]